MKQKIMENETGTKLTCESFEYRNLGKVRFIGIDAWRSKDCQENWSELWARKDEYMPVLDALTDKYGTQITEDCSMMHHNGSEVDTENHYMVGRFFKAGTPVPEGFDYYDVPTEKAAYALYTANKFDGDIGLAYYFTRDQILEDGVGIPYPSAYWHAAVYFNPRPNDQDTSNQSGINYRFGYLFSVSMSNKR